MIKLFGRVTCDYEANKQPLPLVFCALVVKKVLRRRHIAKFERSNFKL